MSIGSKATEFRKGNNWTQTGLADKIQVYRMIVGRYERNATAPPKEIANKIADALEASLDFLVGKGQNATFEKQVYAS